MTTPIHDDEHFMRLAIDAANQGVQQGQTPFGACIVRDGRVLAVNHNQVWLHTDITAHAEIVALRTACLAINSIDVSGGTIYSTTEPCPMCFAAIHWARITRIVYGASISDAAEHGFHEMHLSNQQMRDLADLPTQITTGVLKDQCVDCFHRWAANKEHRPY